MDWTTSNKKTGLLKAQRGPVPAVHTNQYNEQYQGYLGSKPWDKGYVSKGSAGRVEPGKKRPPSAD